MPWPRAVSAEVAAGHLVVRLADGRELAVPVDEFDFLVAGMDTERNHLQLVEGGTGIWWELLDEGVSVPGVFGLPESPRSDPDTREYTVRYRRDEKRWIAGVDGTDLSAAGIDVIDQVDAGEPVKAR